MNRGFSTIADGTDARRPASWRARWPALGLIPLLCGCQQLGALFTVLKGGETINAEYNLPDGPLAVVLDDPEQFGVPADAMQAFHDKITQVFQERKIKARVIPFEDLQRVRQNEAAFDEMSVRQIGEALGADHVIYVKVTYWALREAPGDPYFRGRANAGVKVCSTERKRNVKLWPTDKDYWPVSAQTDRDANESAGAEAQVARLLAEKTAISVAELFHEHKANRRFE